MTAEDRTTTIGVALCTFNGEAFLQRQIDSILGQSRQPDELVISDDGSSDRTSEIIGDSLARAEAAGIRAQSLEGPHRLGVTANFERAVRACSSDLVALSDQDDAWLPHRLEAVESAFAGDTELLLRHEDARLVDRSGAPIGSTLFAALGVSEQDRRDIRAGRGFATYLRRNIATGATMSFRRELLNSALPFPAEWVHDEWLAIIASVVGSVDPSGDVLVDYRQHGANAIGLPSAGFAYRMRRMLGTTLDRTDALGPRARVLADRLAEIDSPEHYRSLAAEKAEFEGIRGTLPDARIARVPVVARAARHGRYSRLASQGRLDIVRDLVARPRRGT